MIVEPIIIKNQVIKNRSKIITNKGFLESFFNPDKNLILFLILDIHLIFVINHNYILKYNITIALISFFMLENKINSYNNRNYQEKPYEDEGLDFDLKDKFSQFHTITYFLCYPINLYDQLHDNYK